jgi:hypothetical protein
VIDGLEGLLDAAEIKHDDGQCAAFGTSCAMASGFRGATNELRCDGWRALLQFAATSSRVLAEVVAKQ